jgi:hypothetical protein
VDPARPVVGESAGGDEAVNVGMKVEVLAPGVKEGDKTDVGPQMFGIGGDGGECGPHGLKQNVVDWFWVLECEGSQGVGDREDDVEIGNRQEVLEPVVDPAMAKGGLAFGAVAVPSLTDKFDFWGSHRRSEGFKTENVVTRFLFLRSFLLTMAV